MPAEHLGVVVDLHRELARRRDDQARGSRSSARPGGGGCVSSVLVQRDQERGGLAGAGLRLAGDVAAGERERQGLRLDRRAQRESGVAYALHDRAGASSGRQRPGYGVLVQSCNNHRMRPTWDLQMVSEALQSIQVSGHSTREKSQTAIGDSAAGCDTPRELV